MLVAVDSTEVVLVFLIVGDLLLTLVYMLSKLQELYLLMVEYLHSIRRTWRQNTKLKVVVVFVLIAKGRLFGSLIRIRESGLEILVILPYFDKLVCSSIHG